LIFFPPPLLTRDVPPPFFSLNTPLGFTVHVNGFAFPQPVLRPLHLPRFHSFLPFYNHFFLLVSLDHGMVLKPTPNDPVSFLPRFCVVCWYRLLPPPPKTIPQTTALTKSECDFQKEPSPPPQASPSFPVTPPLHTLPLSYFCFVFAVEVLFLFLSFTHCPACSFSRFCPLFFLPLLCYVLKLPPSHKAISPGRTYEKSLFSMWLTHPPV